MTHTGDHRQWMLQSVSRIDSSHDDGRVTIAPPMIDKGRECAVVEVSHRGQADPITIHEFAIKNQRRSAGGQRNNDGVVAVEDGVAAVDDTPVAGVPGKRLADLNCP